MRVQLCFFLNISGLGNLLEVIKPQHQGTINTDLVQKFLIQICQDFLHNDHTFWFVENIKFSSSVHQNGWFQSPSLRLPMPMPDKRLPFFWQYPCSRISCWYFGLTHHSHQFFNYKVFNYINKATFMSDSKDRISWFNDKIGKKIIINPRMEVLLIGKRLTWVVKKSPTLKVNVLWIGKALESICYRKRGWC